MQITVAQPLRPAQLRRSLTAVAAQVDAGTLKTVEMNVHPTGVAAVRQALAPKVLGNVAPAAAPATLKYSLDASLTQSLFGADVTLGVDLSALFGNAKTVEKQVTDPATGRITTRRVVEGALGGAAVSALLLSLKTTSKAISDPALAAVALIVLGAVSWPYMSEAELTLKPDGTVTAKVGFARG